MKILVLANAAGGIVSFRMELLKELLKHHTVYVFVPDGDTVADIKSIGCEVELDNFLERRGLNPIMDLKQFNWYRKMIGEHKPDMVITYTIKPNIYGGMASRMAGIPYAVNITGLGTAFQKKGMLQKLVISMYRLALKRAKVVFFENIENCDIMLRHKIVEQNQTHVLMGAGVNLEKFYYSEYPKGEEVTRFLFIGRVMKEKGVEELFIAMEQLRASGFNCTLDILGAYEENYSEWIKRYEKSGWLHYHGIQKDVRPFIEHAHCFVLPSWHEGMANTNLECAAMGRPVITSNIHGCLEAVEDGVSGLLCERKNVDSLNRAMKFFLELTYEERRNMGIAGRKRMEELFDKKKVVGETIQYLMR